MIERDYFTIAQLSKYSGIGTNSLYKAVRARELRHVCLGGRKYIISRKDFEKWFDSKAKNPITEPNMINLTRRPGIKTRPRITLD